MPTPQPIELLLIEDNVADVELMKLHLAEAKVSNRVHVATTGEDALAFMRREEREDYPRPDLVLLDLNLPGRDGRSILSEIKRDPRLRRIPVVVLTSSEAERDIVQSYELGAAAYLVKPMGIDEIATMVSSIAGFWLTVVKLPPGD
jgi:CheY-like chemotaxis protein